MTPVSFWQVSIVADAAQERRATECLSRCFVEPVSSYADFERGQVAVSVYARVRPSPELLRRLEQVLASESAAVKEGGLRIEVHFLRSRDWANAWKRHFRPITVGRKLLVKPGWSRSLPAPGQRVVVLDPGLSFGTGQHPTTRFCLGQIVAHRPRSIGKSFLDVGTGSGILAIAARKLGYHPVDAVDHDPAAVRIAGGNARRNRVQVRIRQGDVARLGEKERAEGYDLVCANLASDLLIKHARRLVGRVRSGGWLVLAGILEIEFGRVRAVYEGLGWRLTRSRKVREWRSGGFVEF
jgi:ribosomal protein L11 methyltransferase